MQLLLAHIPKDGQPMARSAQSEPLWEGMQEQTPPMGLQTT